ncbi:MAG TPA: SDR family oxidoreductase [Hanamia sp.]|nr:SDR family oxidoreductase [Hanamia sp.]
MTNKIALITGGSRGLGKEMALRLAQDGCDVVITYVSQKVAAGEVVKEIKRMGRQATALQFDANDIASINNFVSKFNEEVISGWGVHKFDFLVNNAGMGATIPFMESTEKDFDLFMNVHFKSVYFLTQKLLPLMNDNGRIINISSGTTKASVPGYSLYTSMKGAVEVFSRGLAKELGPRGIRVNVVAPGPIETDFNNGSNRDIPERKKFLASRNALGRLGLAKDIGGVIAFLCSDDGGWINGQRIEVSGGVNL